MKIATKEVITSAAPLQILGVADNGQEFYFRERSGRWDLYIKSIDRLPLEDIRHIVATGIADEFMDSDKAITLIAALLDVMLTGQKIVESKDA